MQYEYLNVGSTVQENVYGFGKSRYQPKNTESVTQYENIHLCSSRKIELPQGDVLLTHVPVHPYVMNEESRDGRKKLLNIHGHIHRPSPELGDKYFNVNYDVEKTFYKLDDILQSKGITR